MAAIIHGTAYVFGVAGTITNAAVQSFQLKDEHQNNTTVMDEIGNEIVNRHDDLVKEGTIVLKHEAAYTEETVEDVITYDTVNYRVTSIDKNEVNNEHREITYSIKTTEYVTLVP
jgi:hypothetical protein